MSVLHKKINYIISLFFFCIAGVVVVGFGAQYIARVFFNDGRPLYVLADLLRFVLVFFYVHLLNKYIYEIKTNWIFKSRNKARHFFTGALMSAIMIFIGFSILFISGAIAWWIPPSFVEHRAGILTIVLTSLATAFWEEQILRGFLLRGLLAKTSSAAAVIGSASLFGVLHIFGPGHSVLSILSATLGGILLGVAFVKTRKIYFSVGLHFGWNCSVYILFSEKMFSTKYINTLYAGNTQFEEGLVGLIVVIVMIVMILKVEKLSEPDIDLESDPVN